MRILLATMQYGPGYSQGTERYLSILADGLRARGHECVFLAGDPQHRAAPGRLGQPSPDDPHLLSLPSRGWMAVDGVAPRRLASLLQTLRPDLVHLANPGHVGVSIVAAARSLRIPVVVTVVDYWWLCPKHTLHHPQRGACDGNVTWRECLACVAADRERGLRRRIAAAPPLRGWLLPLLYFGRWLLRGVSPGEIVRWTRRQRHTIAALDAADAVIFLSDTARDLLAPRLRHARQRRITNGLEPRWFAARHAHPRTAPAPGETRTLGFAGALAPHKGAHVLLEAASRLHPRPLRVRIAGAGDDLRYRALLDGLARDLDVEFLGAVPPEDMPEFLRSLDLLVVPSLWPENLPMVVLEASACGVPVVASRVGGVAELIRDEGRLFDPGSSSGLAECLRRALDDPRRLQVPSVCTAEEMVERTLNVYLECTSRAADAAEPSSQPSS